MFWNRHSKSGTNALHKQPRNEAETWFGTINNMKFSPLCRKYYKDIYSHMDRENEFWGTVTMRFQSDAAVLRRRPSSDMHIFL